MYVCMYSTCTVCIYVAPDLFYAVRPDYINIISYIYIIFTLCYIVLFVGLVNREHFLVLKTHWMFFSANQ